MTVEQAIRDRIAADAPVIALVSTRVYQFVLPQSPTLPAVKVQLISDIVPKHLRGPQGARRARVQVDVYGKSMTGSWYDSVNTIADAIDAAVLFEPWDADSPVTLSVENVERVTRQPIFESDELNQVRMLLDYMVHYRDMS